MNSKRYPAAVLTLMLAISACGSTVAGNQQAAPSGAGPAQDGVQPYGDDALGAEFGPATGTDSDSTGAAAPRSTVYGSSEGGSSSAGSFAGGGTAGGTTTEASRTTAPAAAGDFTPGKVKLAVVAAEGADNFMSQVGLENPYPSSDRAKRWIRGLIDHINETGGAGGHKIELIFRMVDASNPNQDAQVALQNEACVDVTEDQKVDMVIGDMVYWALDCYARHRTPVLTTGIQKDSQELSAMQPWVLPGFFPALDRVARLMAHTLAQQQFLTKKIGVVAFDLPDYRRTVERVLKPELGRHGGKVLETVYTSVTVEDVAAQMANAVLRFKSLGVDRVIFLANGGGAWLFFARQAESQSYRPGYGISTLDQPFYIADLLPPEQRELIRGPGWWFSRDLKSAQQPPPTAQDRRCWDIINKRAGENLQGRNGDTSAASQVCDLVLSIDAALDKGAGAAITRERIPSLYRTLGREYVGSTVGPTNFSPPRLDAVVRYAPLVFDTQCSCPRYSTAWKSIPF